MKSTQIPTKFQIPFANAAQPGLTRPIPVASQSGINPGAASLTDGFPQETFVNTNAGGIPPDGRDFNGLLNQITRWSQWQGAGALVPHDAEFSGLIGGYPQGALLAGTNPENVWLCIVDDNTSNPDTGGAGWLLVATMDKIAGAIPYATAAEVVAGALANKVVSPATLAPAVQGGSWNHAIAGGTANELTASLNPPVLAYNAGLVVRLQLTATNTGPATLDAGAGPLPIKTLYNTEIQRGELLADTIVTLVCTGSAWLLSSISHAAMQRSGLGHRHWVGVSMLFTTLPNVYQYNCIGTSGGAGGGACNPGAGYGSGGGGGAGMTVLCHFDTYPGENLQIGIGIGGAGGANGGAGGATWIARADGTPILHITGGLGGLAGGVGGSTAGGPPGTLITAPPGSLVVNGGYGEDGNPFNATIQGGNGGASYWGGGGRAGMGGGMAGIAFGCGGGGAWGPFGWGAAGGPGLVVLEQ